VNYTSIYGGLRVCTNQYLGDPCVPRNPPVPQFNPGPYFKRRIKRWERAHPNRTRGNGKYFKVGGQIWCHPDDFVRLTAALQV